MVDSCYDYYCVPSSAKSVPALLLEENQDEWMRKKTNLFCREPTNLTHLNHVSGLVPCGDSVCADRGNLKRTLDKSPLVAH